MSVPAARRDGLQHASGMGDRMRNALGAWICIWLALSAIFGWFLVPSALRARSQNVENVHALTWQVTSVICGRQAPPTNGNTTMSSRVPKEWLVHWHSNNPPAGMAADFDGRLCDRIPEAETRIVRGAVRSDGTFDVRPAPVTDPGDAVGLGAILAGAVTAIAAMFFHRRRPRTTRPQAQRDDGARI